MGVEPLAGRFGPAPALRCLGPHGWGASVPISTGCPSTACGFNGHLVGHWGPRPGDASASGWRCKGSGCRPVGYPHRWSLPGSGDPVLRLLFLPASLQGVHGLLATLGWALLHREVICIRPMTPEGCLSGAHCFRTGGASTRLSFKIQPSRCVADTLPDLLPGPQIVHPLSR